MNDFVRGKFHQFNPDEPIPIWGEILAGSCVSINILTTKYLSGIITNYDMHK